MKIGAVLLVTAAFAARLEGPDAAVPAINEIERWQQVGQQPYEFTWTQREEHPKTLVDFEDLTGWKLELYNGAKGELRRSREQQMWGQYVAKFLYSGASDESRVIARPPKPVAIPERFDSIELWGYGNRWSWVADDTTPAADVSVLILDARDKEFTIQLTDIRWKQWWLIHRKVPAEVVDRIVWPARFSGIEIAKGSNKDPRYFFCDSLAFFTEELKPLTFKPQPKRNLKPFRGQIVGLNTGPGTLPFPTREETILPTNFENAFKVTARQPESGRFELVYEGKDARVTYEYRPRTGALGEITASVDGAPAFRPMDGGGVRFADTPEGRVSEGALLSAALDGNVIKASFRHGSRIVDYHLQLWQKSLVFDVWCDGGDATELSFGRVSGVRNPKLILVPYITYRDTNPRVLMSGDAGKPIFTSIWFDWYRTNATQAWAADKPQTGSDYAEVNGGMRYIPKTDGARNNMYDRVFITASPIYEETLPTTDNPPSLRQEEGKQVVWTVSSPRSSFREDHERSRRIRAYGLDKIMQHSHEVTWRDEGDSNTLKLRASPQKGGDAALQWYIKAQNDLGWLQGVYSNYTDFCTVNTNWDPDAVIRLPDGEWRRAWPRNYMLKPSRAVEFDEYYAQRIKEKYGVKMSYTDVHTCAQPWRCDHDARVPGAATMTSLFYAFGQLLLNDQRVYGPTQSEATFQWLYAGLQSGGYGWVYTDVNLLTHPLDAAFMLMKIHPLEANYGMGYTFYYLSRLDPKWRESPNKRDYLDLFLATTIGYGNMGWLAADWGLDNDFGVEAMARSYYMMQQLQQQYAFVRPKKIEYADRNGRMLLPSQAHATGAIADSRLHVEYENGTHVYVNRSPKGTWRVTDRKVELPPSGWLVINTDGGFHELSGNVNGRRIDWVKASAYEFLDGRGQWTEHGSLGAAGSVARRARGGGVVELIDMYGNNRIAFETPGEGRLMAYDWEGKALGEVELRSPRSGWREFTPLPGGRTYLFAPKTAEAGSNLSARVVQ
ncbi:MAG: hypothetical protein KIT09_21935 [Bryobacteraceae bacterium]|nr:hypothetical protein [Bryobacteraceae bacterium]